MASKSHPASVSLECTDMHCGSHRGSNHCRKIPSRLQNSDEFTICILSFYLRPNAACPCPSLQHSRVSGARLLDEKSERDFKTLERTPRLRTRKRSRQPCLQIFCALGICSKSRTARIGHQTTCVFGRTEFPPRKRINNAEKDLVLYQCACITLEWQPSTNE